MEKNVVASNSPSKEFGFGEGMAYAVGAIGIQLTTVMIESWARYYYYPPQGDPSKTTYMSLAAAGWMMLLGRFMDAVSDPIIGLWSDNTRSRMGRRRPFIIFGSLPMALTFILFWFPPVPRESPLNFWWASICIGAFWWAITIVIIPYGALLPEIATTTQGRVRLGVFNSVAMIVGLIIGQLSGIFIEKWGVRFTAILFGIVSFLCFQVTGWGVKERYKGKPEITTWKQLWMEFVYCFKNRAFIVFTIVQTIFALGFFLLYSILPDFNNVILGKGEGFMFLLYLPFLLTCTPMVFLLPKIVQKLGKKRLYALSLLGLAGLLPFLGLISPDLSLKIALAMVLVGLAGIPHAAYYAVPGSFIGEIADYDEQCITGRRREAIYSGAQGFAIKTGMSLTYLVQTHVYRKYGGLRKDNPSAVMLMGPLTGLVCFVAYLIFHFFYPNLRVVKDEKGDKDQGELASKSMGATAGGPEAS